MSLLAGTRLGPYEVLSPLGAGGMGEVYRARDARLKRDVAVKVLPEALLQNTDALARFEREALAVAALSHPGILSIFDVGEAGGVRFAVTELLEGDTLRAFAARGPVPLRRTLEIVHQLADALAAAHEKGFVHRDVKPENVFVTRDGRAKLLDFGLARGTLSFRDPEDSRSPTLDALTEAGAVVGTVAYMSPEQASGLPVDHRSDQFSLGVVLYELLAGRRPFSRDTAAETMAAIIRDEPEPLEKVAPSVPAPVRWLVERLLHKEAGGRYDATRDLSRELASLRSHLSETTTAATGVAPAVRPRRARLASAALAGALAIASAVLGVLYARERGRPPGASPARFEIRLPEGQFLTFSRNSVALSPDGKILVFSAFAWKKPYEERGPSQLFLRPLDSLESRPIPGTEGGLQPVFSPDGQHVAFFAVRAASLKRVPIAGGTVQIVCKCDASFGAAWTSDGSILFASSGGPLQRVPASGGTPEPATTLDVADAEVSHRLPNLLPDGRTVVYTALRWAIEQQAWTKTRLWAWRPGRKERTLLAEGGSDGRWSPPGVLLHAREGNLVATPLDGRTLKTSAPSSPALPGVRHAIWASNIFQDTGAAHFALARDGTIAWVPGSVEPAAAVPVAWVDPSGREAPLKGMPQVETMGSTRVSPDGQRVLVSYFYPSRQADVLDLTRGARRSATFGANPGWAIWGPGPDRITFTSDHEGPLAIYSRRVDAAPGEVTTLWKPKASTYLGVGSWSRDGKALAFISEHEGKQAIFVLEEGREPRRLSAGMANEGHPNISPDGRWLAYTTGESGRNNEVFARALSGEGGTLQVSVGEGFAPLWSHDGTAAFYWQHIEGKPEMALFRVSVKWEAGAPAFGVPARLFQGGYNCDGGPGHMCDVGPDGRFLVQKKPEPAEQRARWDKLLSNRILVDTGGIARLLADARKGP